MSGHWCGGVDCDDVSHEHAADAVRGSELRRHADAAMALLGNASDLIEQPEPHGWDIARLERIEAVLRANRMHESTCVVFGTMPGHCDCWLTKETTT